MRRRILMGLVANITKIVEIPGEEHSATIRKLSHKQLRMASKARQSEGVGFMRELGGELLKALREADTKTVENIQKAQEADITNYDRDVLLKEGIVSWTYEAGRLPDATDFLDEPTASFLAAEIFRFSRGETKEEAKNV
jgi:hypothetical protein